MQITPILLLALLLTSATAQVDIPITVDILNAPPQIVEFKYPAVAPPRSQVIIGVRVRDNNTLGDITTAWAWRTGMNDQNVTATISNTTNDYAEGDYWFTFFTDYAGGLTGQIYIGDEATTIVTPFSIPTEEKKNITLVTGQVNVAALPGSTATTLIKIRVQTTRNATLYAKIADNSGIQAKLGGVPVQGTKTKIKNYPPTDTEDTIELTLTIPTTYPDEEIRRFSITLSLGDQETTADIQIRRVDPDALIAIAMFAIALIAMLTIARWAATRNTP